MRAMGRYYDFNVWICGLKRVSSGVADVIYDVPWAWHAELAGKHVSPTQITVHVPVEHMLHTQLAIEQAQNLYYQ